MQTPAVTNPMAVEAKLAPVNVSTAAVPTINVEGAVHVAGAERIYLRMHAGNVASMIREGTDLLVVSSDGTVLRLSGFYADGMERQLLLMDGGEGLVRMETAPAMADGPMPIYSTAITEAAPFQSLTGSGAEGFVGAGMGTAWGVIAGAGLLGAGIAVADGGDNNTPDIPLAPPGPTPDTTPPAAPSGLAFNADGTRLTGNAEAGSTVTVRDAAGNVIGSGTAGSDGRFELSLSPAQANGETLSVTATDAAGNVSPPATATAPDITAPDAPTGLEVNETGDVITGEGEPGARVEVTDPDGNLVGEGTVGDDGRFEVTLDPPQTDGEALEVRVEDAAGNLSDPASATAPDLGTGTPPGTATVTIDALTGDDIINLAESQGDIQVTGTVTGDDSFTAGDVVEITTNGNTYRGTVNADGTWSVSVRGADLTGGALSVVVNATAQDGTVSVATAERPYTVDLVPPSDSAPTVTIPAASDGVVSDTELAAGLTAEVGLPAGTAADDVVVLRLTVSGQIEEITHTLTEADVQNGTVTLQLGSSLVDGSYEVVAFVRDPAGNPTPTSAPQLFEIDAVVLDVVTTTASLDEADLSLVAAGQIAIEDASGAYTVALNGPDGTFTSRGEAITWQVDGDGQLTGTAGGRLVVSATIDVNGNYTVSLHDGVDHPAGSATLTLPITVMVTDANGTASGAISLEIADGAPVLAGPVTLTPTQPGVYVGTLVTDIGVDGGGLETVTIDGLTFAWNPADDTVSTSGTSPTLLSYAVQDGTLTATTIRGETVEVDLQTGEYRVTVSGTEAQAPVNDAPYVGMANTGGLLGLVNADVLGLVRLDENQFFTASDRQNDITEVELTFSSLVNLTGTRFWWDESLAAELGIDVEVTGFSTGIPGYSQISITAADGTTLDNWKLNELLGTVTLSDSLGGVVDLSLISGVSMTATDAAGASTTIDDFDLADVAVGAPLIGSVLPSTFYSGEATADTYTAPEGTGGAGQDDRIYGYGGDDILNAGLGDDIVRGGAGNDTIDGGGGNDVLIGGQGEDTLTGGEGIDLFRFERGDQLGHTGVPTDVITDFNPAGLALNGDVLDLADMLQGEGRVGRSPGNLGNYLHFESTVDGTLIHISTSGGFSGGFDAASTDQRILLEGVDLTEGFGSDIEIIADLLARGKLITDTATSADPSAHGDLTIGAEVVDGDGSRGQGSVVLDDSGLPSADTNTAPVVGTAAESLLNLGLLGFSLSEQDLLVADEDNNLASVTLEYAPLLAVNLTPISFGYNQAMASAFGYQVEVYFSEGLLGAVAPTARIEISSLNGERLDNAEINTFLETLYLTDADAGLLSSTVLSANLLNAITLTASDVWGESSSAVIGTFLDVNLLNSLDGPDATGAGGQALQVASFLEDLVALPDADGLEGDLLADPLETLASGAGSALEQIMAQGGWDGLAGPGEGMLEGVLDTFEGRPGNLDGRFEEFLDDAGDLWLAGGEGNALAAAGTAFDALQDVTGLQDVFTPFVERLEDQTPQMV